MQVSDLLVEVRDRSLTRVAQITPESLDLSFTLRSSAVGEWQLRLPVEHPAVAHLRVPGAGIVVTGPDGVLLSGPTTTPTIDADLTDPTGLATVAGVTDDALLWGRLAYPTPTVADVSAQQDAYDVRTGPAETVMLDFVNANLAAPAPAERRVPGFSVPVSQRRGPTVTKSARFDVLGDLLREIAAVAGLRFHVVQVGTALVLQVLDVIDRRSTVRFDLVNGTLASQQVATSPPALTRAIVAGQGEGADRTLVERSTAESLAAESLYGPWGRIERFIDQRSTDDPVELAQAGDKVLGEEGTIATAVKAVPSDDLTMRYAVDWGVGDAVTVVVGGQETRSAVTAVTVLASSSGVTVGAAIGDVQGFDPKGALGQRVEDTAARVSALERTAESGGRFTIDGEVLAFQPREDAPVIQVPTLPYLTRTGVVEPYYTQGNPRVQWDGDTILSGPYRYLGGWRPVAGDQVIGTRNTRTGAWVISPLSTPVVYPPNWHALTLQNGWGNFGQSYVPAAFTRTASGLVKVTGLVIGGASSATAGTVIGQLPSGFRPSTLLMFASQNGDAGGASGSLDVRPDGTIAVRSASAIWTSLDNITFWAADALPESAWTTATLLNSYQHFVDVSGGGWARASYYKDPNGVVWERGLLMRAATPISDLAMFSTPSGYRPVRTQHRRTTVLGGHGYVYKNLGGWTSWGSGGTPSYFSIDGAPYVDAGSPLTWTPLSYQNSWVDYDTNAFSPGAFTRTPDGVVHLRGLIRAGTVGAIVATLPPGHRPAARTLLGTVSNQATARLDVSADGYLIVVAGSSTWFSLDGLCYVASQ